MGDARILAGAHGPERGALAIVVLGEGPGAALVRAREVAARWGGRVIPFGGLDDALAQADVVISTTAAACPTLRS